MIEEKSKVFTEDQKQALNLLIDNFSLSLTQLDLVLAGFIAVRDNPILGLEEKRRINKAIIQFLDQLQGSINEIKAYLQQTSKDNDQGEYVT